jgi:hypothetical protein
VPSVVIRSVAQSHVWAAACLPVDEMAINVMTELTIDRPVDLALLKARVEAL